MLSIVRTDPELSRVTPHPQMQEDKAALLHYQPVIDRPAPLGTIQMHSCWKASTSSKEKTESVKDFA